MSSTGSTFVISLTPYTEQGQLDEEALRAHLRRLAAAGIGVYLGGSGSGEGYTLTEAERDRLFAIGREELGGQVPVRAMGVEPRSAEEMVALADEVARAGLDAIQIYSLDVGHGNRPRDEELEDYLHTVLGTVSLPVVLSSHQAMGYALPCDLVSRLVEQYDHIIGIHYTHPDVAGLVRMLAALEDRIPLYVGGPMHALTALALGAEGYLSSEGNLAPRLCMRVIEFHRAGNLRERDRAFAKLLALFCDTQRLGGIAAAKGALRALGLPGGWPRPPRLPVDDSAARELADRFLALGLSEIEQLAHTPTRSRS